MSDYHWIEPFAGSAAVAVHLMGGRQQVVPYQGSKWKLRKQIASALHARGLLHLSSVHLFDGGPWGHTWNMLLSENDRRQVIAELHEMASHDPKVIFDELQGEDCPAWLPSFAAQHLFLQRLAFSGKHVMGDLVWRSPGFNTTSAYGVDATDKFGAVRPMVRSLIEVLEKSMQQWNVPMGSTAKRVEWGRSIPMVMSLLGLGRGRPVFYLDPPYSGTTSYGLKKLDLDWLIGQAVELSRYGLVMFSYDQAVCLPADAPDDVVWTGTLLSGVREGTDQPFRSRKEEWLMVAERSVR